MIGTKFVGVTCGAMILSGGLGPSRCDAEQRPEVAAPEPPPEPVSALKAAEAAVGDAMEDHFSAAKRIEAAAMHGRLDDGHRAASDLLAASPSSYPADWMPWVLQVRSAATQTLAATDNDELAAATAQIVAACGACHAALGRGPRFEASPRPADGTPAMRVHRWATQRMWEGIVGPSDSAWRSGTKWFPALPDCGSDLGGEALDPAAAETARERAESLAGRAHGVPEAERATVYGEFLSTCAQCHASGCSPSE